MIARLALLAAIVLLPGALIVGGHNGLSLLVAILATVAVAAAVVQSPRRG